MTTKTKIATPTPHILLNESGRAWIDGTGVEISEVIQPHNKAEIDGVIKA